MTIIEGELGDFIGSKHFFSLDFSSNYLKCSLEVKSDEACYMIAPKSTLVSTRVLQSPKHFSLLFQSTFPLLMDSRKLAIKSCINNFTLHTRTESQLLNHLEETFETCTKCNLYFSAKMSVLYTKKIKWCSWVVDCERNKVDPRNLEATRTMWHPIIAEYLFVPAHTFWPLDEHFHPILLQTEETSRQYTREKLHTSRATHEKCIKNIILHTLSWGMEHKNADASIQDGAWNAVKCHSPIQTV